MANSFGTDVLIQAPDPKNAASFYIEHLGFEITGKMPHLISLHGQHTHKFSNSDYKGGRERFHLFVP